MREIASVLPRLPLSVGSFTVALLVLCSLHGVLVAQSIHDYDGLIQKGRAQLQAGVPDEALAVAQQAIAQDASRWEGYALAGEALMNLKRYEEAVDKLSSAIERAPQNKQDGLRELRRQCLAGGSESAPASAGGASQPVAEANITQAEIVMWKSIENSRNPADFQTYLDQYPRGAFVALAKRHLAEAQAKTSGAQLKASDRPALGNDARPGLQLEAIHWHAGWTCSNCDKGTMNVSREGIEFHGSAHQFKWKREEIAEVKKRSSDFLGIKAGGTMYNFLACATEDYESNGDKCKYVDAAILANQIMAALNGK